MAPRRRVFGEQYGSAKAEQSRGGGKLPPPQTTAPVPLSLQAQAPQQSEPLGVPVAQGEGQLPPHLQQLLQQLLAQYGGAHG